MSDSGRDRTRTCKGCSPRPASNRVPSCQLARPSVSVRMVGFEPTLSGTPSRRIARLSHILIWRPHKSSQPRVAGFAPTPPHYKCGAEPNQQGCTLRSWGTVASSGGWGRTSGLRVFGAALSPPELHRNTRDAGRSRTCLIVGLQPTAWPSGPGVFFVIKSRRWDSNPLGPRYEGGARPAEHRRPV